MPLPELVCDWQQAASNVLVAVGKRFISSVMEEMLSKFQPGVLPHHFVVQTLANLSVSNGRRHKWAAALGQEQEHVHT
ncbi:hypothetical protein E2I00_012109 [Balaenoptera physalus]|uniref:MROH2B-like N-terminal HEAT-repeats domain-containing protein n=1 Tax=Balaenoptera physalus TaxID=9770 RepID=A0A643C9H5_BALPH|nr:hypothetical protein E2I00_012109 [Balaenoptera physalus]